MPLGRKDTPVRIVRSPRAAAAVVEAMQLQDTIGSEEAVLLVVDPSGLPRTLASLDLLSEKIVEGTYRATPQGTGAAAELEPGWGSDMSEAASALRGAAKITLGDLHLDAKLYTHLHPHGTGSLRAESDRVSISEYLKNRLLSLQTIFGAPPCGPFSPWTVSSRTISTSDIRLGTAVRQGSPLLRKRAHPV